MEYRILGRTGLSVSVIGFGAGPISGLMTSGRNAAQSACVSHAISQGINWFDTAAGYGDGESERNLGASFRELGCADSIHIATKVRLLGTDTDDMRQAIRRSVEASLSRLGVSQLTLLQLHNGVTAVRDEIPTSLTVADVLGPSGVAAVFEELRAEGRVRYLGVTGTGTAEPLRAVLGSGRFDTLQIPFSLANPSAGFQVSGEFSESNYGNVFTDCERLGIGVFAIRVYAGGALLEKAPSPYTYRTKFFPLDLYQRDLARAATIRQRLPNGLELAEAAVRFAITPEAVSSALIGFSNPSELDAAAHFAERGRLATPLAKHLFFQ